MTRSSDRICEMCGKEGDTILYPDAAGGEYRCVKCSRHVGLILAAESHLQKLLEATMTQWLYHWRKVGGGVPELTEALEVTIAQLDIPLAERRAWVQAELRRADFPLQEGES